MSDEWVSIGPSNERGYQAAQRAAQDGRLRFNWTVGAQDRRWWARKTGRSAPIFFFGRAFRRLILATPENFHEALVSSGVDVYVPRSYLE